MFEYKNCWNVFWSNTNLFREVAQLPVWKGNPSSTKPGVALTPSKQHLWHRIRSTDEGGEREKISVGLCMTKEKKKKSESLHEDILMRFNYYFLEEEEEE